MFQYACGRALALRRNTSLLLDRDIYLSHDPKRKYGLDAFNIKEEFTDSSKVAHARVYREESLRFDPCILYLPDETVLQGYFQCASYWKDFKTEILSDFFLRSNSARAWASRIAATENSVAVHFRRTDNTDGSESARFHGTPRMGYYDAAMEKLGNCSYFAFSDDPQWVRENWFGGPVVEGCTPAEDMFLMSLCRHAIIANSSFSLMASLIGPYQRGGICIAPARWFLNEEAQAQSQDIVPAGYICL